MKLTRADKEAIKMGNAGYILNKGAEAYKNENFYRGNGVLSLSKYDG